MTEDAGTGFVHTAPGHGADDYALWLASGQRDIPETVDEDGAYYPDVPLFGGLKVLETEGKKAGKFGPANAAVTEKLIEAGALLARGRLEHSYPHSWRSKAPVIFRNTPQWFIGLDAPLRRPGRTTAGPCARRALRGHRRHRLPSRERPRAHPRHGRGAARLAGSRQRAWGSPMAIFVDKTTGAPLQRPAWSTPGSSS